jgi:ribosomal protein L11 methyltransferase
VRCGPEAVEAVSEILREIGAYGVEILGEAALPAGDDVWAAPAAPGPDEAAIYLPAEGARAVEATVRELCRERIEPYFGPALVRLAVAPQVDWVEEYRRSVRAMRVVPGLWVEPPWDSARPGAGERVLRIMPGAAFGYGDHPTTATCLLLLLRWLQPGQDVVDMGSGSGILGAAALALGARRLRAYDLDPLAVDATRDTLRRNGMRAHVRLGTLPKRAERADLVLANISGQGLRPWLGRLRRAVHPGGLLILGGILRQDTGFDQTLEDHGLAAVDEAVAGDWRAIAARPA